MLVHRLSVSLKNELGTILMSVTANTLCNSALLIWHSSQAEQACPRKINYDLLYVYNSLGPYTVGLFFVQH